MDTTSWVLHHQCDYAVKFGKQTLPAGFYTTNVIMRYKFGKWTLPAGFYTTNVIMRCKFGKWTLTDWFYTTNVIMRYKFGKCTSLVNGHYQIGSIPPM